MNTYNFLLDKSLISFETDFCKFTGPCIFVSRFNTKKGYELEKISVQN
jgi:hypothetical protein